MVNLYGFAKGIIAFGVIIGLMLWGLVSLYDYYLVFDGIKSPIPIKPRIELVVKDNKVDTLYVYELKGGNNEQQ
jgi:hypothetical protein